MTCRAARDARPIGFEYSKSNTVDHPGGETLQLDQSLSKLLCSFSSVQSLTPLSSSVCYWCFCPLAFSRGLGSLRPRTLASRKLSAWLLAGVVPSSRYGASSHSSQSAAAHQHLSIRRSDWSWSAHTGWSATRCIVGRRSLCPVQPCSTSRGLCSYTPPPSRF